MYLVSFPSPLIFASSNHVYLCPYFIKKKLIKVLPNYAKYYAGAKANTTKIHNKVNFSLHRLPKTLPIRPTTNARSFSQVFPLVLIFLTKFFLKNDIRHKKVLRVNAFIQYITHSLRHLYKNNTLADKCSYPKYST